MKALEPITGSHQLFRIAGLDEFGGRKQTGVGDSAAMSGTRLSFAVRGAVVR